MSAKKTPLSLTVLALALTLLWVTAGCGREEKKNPGSQAHGHGGDPGELTSRRVENVLNQVGTIKFAQDGHHPLGDSRAGGRDSFPRRRKEVKKGQMLVKLDAAKVRADVRNLEQRIHQLKIRLAHQKRNLERNRPLVKDKLVSQMKYDDLETEIALAQAALAQAQADMSRQKEMLDDTEIRAPFDGVVGSKNLSVGDYLKAGEPVVRVVSLNPLEMAFSVPERFKAGIFKGQEVRSIFTGGLPRPRSSLARSPSSPGGGLHPLLQGQGPGGQQPAPAQPGHVRPPQGDRGRARKRGLRPLVQHHPDRKRDLHLPGGGRQGQEGAGDPGQG